MEFPGRGGGRDTGGQSHPPSGQVLAPFALIRYLYRLGAKRRAWALPPRRASRWHRPLGPMPWGDRVAARQSGARWAPAGLPSGVVDEVATSGPRIALPPVRPAYPTKERFSAGRPRPTPPRSAWRRTDMHAGKPIADARTNGHQPVILPQGTATGPKVASVLARSGSPREARGPRTEVAHSRADGRSRPQALEPGPAPPRTSPAPPWRPAYTLGGCPGRTGRTDHGNSMVGRATSWTPGTAIPPLARTSRATRARGVGARLCGNTARRMPGQAGYRRPPGATEGPFPPPTAAHPSDRVPAGRLGGSRRGASHPKPVAQGRDLLGEGHEAQTPPQQP